MGMYCSDCGSVFRDEWALKYTNARGDIVYACPDCKGFSVSESGYCNVCGEPIHPDETYCDECKWELKKIWEQAVCKVMDHTPMGVDYTEVEQRFLEYLADNGVL